MAPFPTPVAQRIIAQELGLASVDDIFTGGIGEVVASASLGQVMRAILILHPLITSLNTPLKTPHHILLNVPFDTPFNASFLALLLYRLSHMHIALCTCPTSHTCRCLSLTHADTYDYAYARDHHSHRCFERL